MNRRSASLPKSPLNTRTFLRRTWLRGPAVLALPLLLLNQSARAVNTADNVVSGQTDLSLAATYSGGLPTTTSDVTFTAQTYSPATFTLGTPNFNLSIGTLNDLSTTPLIIQGGVNGGTDTITLNTAANSVSGTPADLLYVATGSSLTIQNSATGVLNLAVAAAGNFDIAGSATVGSLLSGTAALAKTGVGTLTLTNANTYSGALTVSAGAVNLDNQLALRNSTVTNSVANGLTFNSAVTGHAFTVGGLAGAGNLALTDDASNAVALTIGANSANNTYSGALSGTGSLTKLGTGTETLSGANTYTGTTTITNGTLVVGTTAGGSLASGNNVTFIGTSAFTYQGMAAGSTQTLGTVTSSAGDNTVTSTYGTSGTTTLAIGTYTRTAGATTNFVNSGGTAGTTNLITLGNVTANTFISPGTFSGGSSYAFYDAGGFVRALNYTNDATAANTSTQTGAISVLAANTTAATQNAQFVGSAGTASTAASATTASTTLPVASGATFAVGEAVTGTGIANNTYVTAISGNTLTLSANATVASGATVTPYNNVSAQGTQTLNTLNLSGAGASVALSTGSTLTTNGILRSGELATGAVATITGGTIASGTGSDLVIRTDAATDFLTINSAITNAVPLVKSGLGTLTIGGAVNNTGGIIDNAGALTISGTISGPGSITVNSTTALALNAGTNTFTGGIVLVNSTVGTNSVASLGSGSLTLGPSTPNAVGLQERPSPGTVTNAIIVNPGTSALTQRSLSSTNGSSITFSGTQTLNNGATIAYGSGGGSIFVSGAISGTGNVTIGGIGAVRNGATTLSGSVNPTGTIIYDQTFLPTGQRAGTGLFTISGVIGSNVTGIDVNVPTTDGAMVLSAANTFPGDTTLTSGKINLQNALALQNSVLNTVSAANSTVTFGTPGVTIFSAATLGGLTGSGNVILNDQDTSPDAVNLTIGNSNVTNGSAANPNTLNPVYSGVLSDAGLGASVTKVGTNTQTLTGNNTFTGVTTITAGVLNAAGTGTNKALGGTTGVAINAGTLQLSTANQINATAPISIGAINGATGAVTSGMLSLAAGANQGTAATVTGGTVNGRVTTGGTITGTTTAGLGALTLNSTATLAYSGPGTTLVFGAFNPNGNVLTITGYTNTSARMAGSSGTGTDDRLVFSGDQSGNFADFNFGTGPGVGVSEVALDSGYFEVVGSAVPEPSTFAGCLVLLAGATWCFRRRNLAL